MPIPNVNFENASPNPEYLIKSIAEQGYSLETSLADLMDNSISANADKIEVLIDADFEPFTLFMADNGNGMTEDELRKNMQFPSNSPEFTRNESDLGRFGLGLKTASFSQTRKFTVLSKPKGENKFCGRTWDVDYLRDKGWKIIINSEEEINELIARYKQLSQNHLNGFDKFEVNTIVIWQGLYKFEHFLKPEKKKTALKKEINEVTVDYLSLVFHRFMEKKENPLQIRINNKRIRPFNPFPEEEKDFRQLEPKQSFFGEDVVKIEGFVLPSRAIKESQDSITNWTTRFRGLMDMEGLYIYRANRIILFGGWNGLIRKAPRLQLARLRVEVGNQVDDRLHLNVAKSKIAIPHELKIAFESYIGELKIEAEREFYNRGIRKFSGNKTQNHLQLFERSNSNKGAILELNPNFPLITSLQEGLSKKQNSQLNMLFRMVNTRINEIRRVHEEKEFIGIEKEDGVGQQEIVYTIKQLLDVGLSKESIKKDILPNLGFKLSTLPDEIKQLL
ncbi:MAG: ATP-binding protein [Marinifilaceae bacterium]